MTEKTLPYAMLLQASIMMKEIDHIEDHPDEELQIVSLLNKAETFPWISQYQLGEGHRELADLYYSSEIFGSALDHYQIALRFNPKCPVKRKVSSIKKMTELRYSLDPNIASEPDLSFCEDNTPIIAPDPWYVKAIQECKDEAKEIDSVYDPVWESAVEKVLSRLPDDYRTAFYKCREEPHDGVLSERDLDLMRLVSMAKSYIWQKKHKERDPEIEEILKYLEEIK